MSDTVAKSSRPHVEDTKEAHPLTILLHKSMVKHAKCSAPVSQDQVACRLSTVRKTIGQAISLPLQVCGADLVVQMVKDASNGHLLKQLILADICQGCVVGRGPQTSLHQDSQRRTV